MQVDGDGSQSQYAGGAESAATDELVRAYFTRQTAIPAPSGTHPDLISHDPEPAPSVPPPDAASVQAAIAILQRAGHEVRIRGLKDLQKPVAGPSTVRIGRHPIEIGLSAAAKPVDGSRGPPKRKYSMNKRPSVQTTSRRLSSVLVADPNDPECRPYACAYAACTENGIDPATGLALPDEARSTFRTSSELLVHWKTFHEHEGERGLPKPFMCAIDGCYKDWKNLAGINYHIQVSNDHFPNRGKPKDVEVDGETPRRSKTRDQRDAARKFSCPVEGCTKSYQQTSGLKYHLTSGKEHLEADIGDWQALLTQAMAEALHRRT